MFEDPVFFKRDDVLSQTEADYYQEILYRNLKIGTEVEFSPPKGANPVDVLKKLEVLLKPSYNLDFLGELGVFNVIKEHCGIEVQVIGRPPHWHALYQQYSAIVDILLQEQVRVRPTCGLHFHLLSIGLSEQLPEIILANMWNLVRRHAPGLKFITSGGEREKNLCRRRQHNAHQEVMEQSPAFTSMKKIQENLKASLIVPEHQNFFNLEHVRFSEDGKLNNFHVELRFPDGDLSPTSIVAKTFLFFSLTLKAVEISKYGLLHVGKKHSWERKKELLDFLSNNDGDAARSDTSKIGEQEIKELQENALELLYFLKAILNRFNNPAYTILKELAMKPISLRRIEHDDWSIIEQELHHKAFFPSHLDEIDHKLTKIIELYLIKRQPDPQSWLRAAIPLLNISREEIKRRIDNYYERYPFWDHELGSFIFRN